MVQRTATSTFDARPHPRVTLVAAIGSILGGDLHLAGEQWSVGVGWVASLGAAFHLLDGQGSWPLLTVGASYARGGASVTGEGAAGDGRLSPTDLRFSITLGKTIRGLYTPYLAARRFTGGMRVPLADRELTGGDRGHHQVAVGGSLSLPGGHDAWMELAFLGERRLALGVGRSF